MTDDSRPHLPASWQAGTVDGGEGPPIVPRSAVRGPRSLLIWRVGGIGDLLWCTAALPVLHRLGFLVDFCTDGGGREVLANNPYVRRLIHFAQQRDPEGQGLTDPENRQNLNGPRV